MNLYLAGFRGSFDGYEDALIWREPLVVGEDGRELFPQNRYWSQSTLAEITPIQSTAFTRLSDVDVRVEPGDLVMISGPVSRKRIELANVDLGLYGRWHDAPHGFLVCIGTLSLFRRLSLDVSARVQSAYWTAIAEGQFAEAESFVRVLAQNEAIDRRQYYVLAALHAVLERDPGRVQTVARMARSELGLDEATLFSSTDRLWRAFRALGDWSDAPRELDAAVRSCADEFWPTVRLSELTHTELRHHADVIAHTFEQGRRQGVKVRLDISGIESAQRPWLPPLALIAHNLSHGSSDVEVMPYDGDRPLRMDRPSELSSGVAAALGRSGVLRAIQRRAEEESRLQSLDRGSWAARPAPVFRIEKKELEELLVADLHAGVDVVFNRDVIERLLPTWIQAAFPSAVEQFFVHASKIAGELVKNVREHAGLRRTRQSESTLHLAKTRGGTNSTDRLWIVVSDNGIGVRGSLEARLGEQLLIPTSDALRQLVTPADAMKQAGLLPTSDLDVRGLTGAGDGLSDLLVLCRELEHATGFPAQVFYFSTSETDEGFESAIAQVRPETGHATVDMVTTPYGTSGTVAIVQLPSGSGAVRAERRAAGDVTEALELELA